MPPSDLGDSHGNQRRGSFMFTIIREHARGGLGTVSLGVDENLKRQVAVKEVRPDRIDNAADQQRLRQEAEITAQLDHPGIVPIHAVGQDAQGRPYYVMRFMQGQTLADAIRDYHSRPSSVGFRDLLQRFVAISQTIAYAHSKNIIHRDLKPGNVMLGKFGETLIFDLGLAKRVEDFPREPEACGEEDTSSMPTTVDEREPLTSGAVPGTPAYMSPEQAGNQRNLLGPATDIYSLGAILYQILTNRSPYPNTAAARGQVLAGPPPTPSHMKQGVPTGLEKICLKAMARRIENRYANAAALSSDVERWLADEPVTAYPEPWHARAKRWMRKHPTLISSVVAALCAGVTALAISAALLNKAWTDEKTARAAADASATREAASARAAAASALKEADAAKKERTQRERAERNFQLAFNAHANLISELHDHWKSPALIPLRRELLKVVTQDCDQLIAELEFQAQEKAHAHNYQNTLAIYAEDLAGLLSEDGKTTKADALFANAHRLREELCRIQPMNEEYRSRLGKTYRNLGMHRWKSDQDAARTLEWYERSMTTLTPLVQRAGPDARASETMLDVSRRRAEVLMELGRDQEAVQAWDELLKLDVGTWRDLFRNERAIALAASGDHRTAIAETDEIAGKVKAPAALYLSAVVYTFSSTRVGKDAGIVDEKERVDLSERYATRAVELLREATSKGFGRDKVLLDPSLKPLHGREDFQKLIRELLLPAKGATD